MEDLLYLLLMKKIIIGIVMNVIGNIELTQKQNTYLVTVFTIIILSLIVYLFLIIAEGILLYVALLIFVLIVIIRIVLFYVKRSSKSIDLDEDIVRKYYVNNQKIIVIVTIILFILILSPHIICYPLYNSNKSDTEIRELVEELTVGIDSNYNKTLTILKWFDRGVNKQENMSNMYYRFRQEDVLILLYFKLSPNGFIYSKYPHVGVRLPESTENWDSWIYHTRIGMCGEFSRIFSTMCYYANLSVRQVYCRGEDHVWNEVKIDDNWIIIDATAVNLPDSNGFNLSWDFMENKVKGDLIQNGINVDEGNVSYVYATYPDYIDDKVDITERYTDVINISIKVIDNKEQPVDSVKVKLISYNRLRRMNTALSKITNESGYCNFTIGGGDYSFEVSYKELSGRLRDSFNEDIQYHNRTIILM